MTRRKRKIVKSEEKVLLKAGITYLIKEEKPQHAFSLFVKGVSKGIPGLCITRSFPLHISQNYKLTSSIIFWLTRRKGDKTLDPVQLTMISHTIQEFISKSKQSITILDGIEYLIIQNDFKPVIRFIQHIRDEVLIKGANLLIPCSPQTLPISELKILERELELYITNEKSEKK